jgi:hypothetical protein
MILNSKKVEKIVQSLEMSFCHLDDTTQREIAWLYLKYQLEKDFNGVGWLLKRTEGLIDEAKAKLDKKKIIP